MKKLTCFINDSKLLEKIKDFCAREKFIADIINSAQQFEYDAASVVYITDMTSEISIDGLKDIPVCFIGSEKLNRRDLYKLPKDFEYIHLRCLVDAVTHSGCFEFAAVSAFPVCLSKTFKIKNDIFNIEKVVFSLTKDFVYFLDFSSLEKVRVGLSEMLTNAIEHGNMGITGDDKLHATESGTYYDLVNEKLSTPSIMKKLVTFTYTINKEGINMSIEDEGKGFKADSLPDPTDPESLLKLHGRGILITRMYFDEVKYNDKGNKVNLSKRF
ncbi:putative anti-sigma regulatory factor, serine/threonine protein kinase [Denitrovibrio acetiphilus DSM 12809]|uniref:Putative anti-sigma regulatory factor, serine/threonine protein kinase n=1 Tax=Denitrovibrio acetiphilus (strain DSM 12809 / NBRC 114555 / N2460) TaxID=522772 RepID=D4H607_DENA2|nr:ATP-binding protein [Denitrovibrio acetiphilus]ADD67653.1 putative anti-sigma regulatory factor, serine/threonine protein kinase [Denitrovibrio acetiphilus DSM 12809]